MRVYYVAATVGLHAFRARLCAVTVALAGLDFVADEELIESICENEKDFSHMVGK
jgi:hypothetical protein